MKIEIGKVSPGIEIETCWFSLSISENALVLFLLWFWSVIAWIKDNPIETSVGMIAFFVWRWYGRSGNHMKRDQKLQFDDRLQ